MRKLFMLLSLGLVVSLVFSSGAMAQSTQVTPSDGSGDTLGDACPAGQFPAIPAGSLGEIGFRCFDTAEEAEYYSNTGQLLPEQPQVQQPQQTAPTAPAAQYEDGGMADDEMTQLPSTGGPALPLAAAFTMLLLGAGGLMLKRRMN